MPFATACFDSDNTTIVLTKDYINCERNYFIMFARGPTTTVNDVANDVELKWIHEMAPPFRSFPDLAKAVFGGDDERDFCGV